MKITKNGIKLIVFIIILLITIVFFVIFFNRSKDYELEYDYKEYHVKESYNKDLNIYSFKISKDDIKFDYSYKHDYTTKRKLINAINYEDNCMSINVFDEESQTICLKDGKYYDKLIEKQLEETKVDSNPNFEIYDDNYDYYVWNGYGLTNKNDNKEYNFLSNESYTNELYYQFNEYIVFADYDQKHSFNKVYIFNNKTKKIDSFDLTIDISYDSYFNGYIGDSVYLYDCTNKIQYQLDIKEKKIRIASKGDNAVYFDKHETTINKYKLFYNQLLFLNNNLYTYFLRDNKVYYNIYDSSIEVQATNIKTDHLLYSDGENVYFINNTILYKFDRKDGLIKIAHYFEWNFDYLNKIFVFSR